MRLGQNFRSWILRIVLCIIPIKGLAHKMLLSSSNNKTTMQWEYRQRTLDSIDKTMQ